MKNMQSSELVSVYPSVLTQVQKERNSMTTIMTMTGGIDREVCSKRSLACIWSEMNNATTERREDELCKPSFHLA